MKKLSKVYKVAQQWVRDADGDKMAAFARFSAYSLGGDPLEVALREAPENEIRFDVVSCAHARFFNEIGALELGFLLMCGADLPIAEGIGVEFSREHTIMQGADQCDFRYVLD